MLRNKSEPVNPEAEQACLGAVLLDPDLIGHVINSGGANLFADPVHAEIFRVACNLDRDGLLVTPVTIAEALRGQDLGGLGVGYVARIAGAAALKPAFRGYVDLLADLARKRTILAAIESARDAIQSGEEQADIIAGRLEAALIAAQVQGDGKGPVSMLRAVTVAMEQTIAAFNGECEQFVRTGIGALDRLISGLYPGELILLGGRPSMGKTGVALSIALNAARAGYGVCIASLEMNPEAMALRALSEATSNAKNAVYYSSMRRGELTEPQIATLRDCARAVADLPIAFLPRGYDDIGALMAGAKQVHRSMRGGMRLMVIDYAQLLRSQARSRYEQITEISISLKRLAGQLNVPVLAMSQLSRAVEKREDKRPNLSDLRESGQLEQDADAVLFCYRDEYYLERDQPENPDELELWEASLARARNRLEIIVAKQRQGAIGTAHVRFNPATNLIWED